MRFTETPLKGAFVVELEPFADNRGLFARTYCKKEFATIGFDKEFVQFNFSKTDSRGTIRGLHFQKAEYAESKLIRCIRGNIFDVLVDLRPESKTYLEWFGVELSEENMKMILVPEGFAHGFQTLTDNAQLIYHHSQFYAPGSEGGVRYDDPAIAVEWPLDVTIISEKDKNHPLIDHQFSIGS